MSVCFTTTRKGKSQSDVRRTLYFSFFLIIFVQRRADLWLKTLSRLRYLAINSYLSSAFKKIYILIVTLHLRLMILAFILWW